MILKLENNNTSVQYQSIGSLIFYNLKFDELLLNFNNKWCIKSIDIKAHW